MVYEEYKIYGPYKRKDGRLHVVLVHVETKKKKTVSYPKFLVEKHYDKYLKPNETVDHIDCNFINNNISNLRIIDRSQHAKEDVLRSKEQNFICPWCNKKFTLIGKRLHNAKANRERKNSHAGPFCSRSCASKYSRGVQLGDDPLPVIKIIPEYTTLKELRKEDKK